VVTYPPTPASPAPQPYVVKYLDLADDWTMRAAGDLGGASLTA
jgi:hypothetical protein